MTTAIMGIICDAGHQVSGAYTLLKTTTWKLADVDDDDDDDDEDDGGVMNLSQTIWTLIKVADYNYDCIYYSRRSVLYAALYIA